MRWKSLFRRRPTIERGSEFGHRVKRFDLPADGVIEYAQWLHPRETEKSVDQDNVDALREFIVPGDFVIDIGAHTGDTTVPMAVAAGAQGLTLALEPNPYVFRVLAVNARLNPEKTHIVPLPYAATADDGTFTFHYSDGGFCNGGFRSQERTRLFRRKYPLEVQGRDLQQVVENNFSDWLNRLSYVKVDAEGYDLRVLESIESLIRHNRPVISSEVYKKLGSIQRDALFDFFDALGYDVHLQSDGAASLVGESITRNQMRDRRHFDVIAVPRKSVVSRAA